MANIGDSFITTLREAHLGWGELRYTNTREIIYNEGYLQIPARIARRLNIYNSNQNNGNDEYGINLFYCNSSDGFLDNVTLKAAGCSNAGDVYAKQFQGSGDLKLLGRWFNNINAQVGDRIQITWTDTNSIFIERL